MSDKIASYKEVVLSLNSLESLTKFMKANNIKERSRDGELLIEFQKQLVRDLTSNLPDNLSLKN